mgnify:FL=1
MGLQLRDQRNGKVFPLSPSSAIEITDKQGNIALLIRIDQRGVIQLVTKTEDPDIAEKYAKHFGIAFSSLLNPDLTKLQHNAAPTPIIS